VNKLHFLDFAFRLFGKIEKSQQQKKIMTIDLNPRKGERRGDLAIFGFV
jgi:hypothetical protein